MSNIYRVMFYQHNSNAMIEIVLQGYWGIMHLMGSPHDDLVNRSVKNVVVEI